MKFLIDLWMDGYDSDEDEEAGCREFIDEQLDFTASSVKILMGPSEVSALEIALAQEREKVRRLREAVECLEIGACACAIPHPGERATLQMAVDMARKLMAETSAPTENPGNQNAGNPNARNEKEADRE